MWLMGAEQTPVFLGSPLLPSLASTVVWASSLVLGGSWSCILSWDSQNTESEWGGGSRPAHKLPHSKSGHQIFFVLRESFTSTKLRVLVSLLCTKPAVIHCQNNTKNGAQLGEHLTGKEKVLGSIPSTSWVECHGWFVTPALGKWRQETEFQRWLCLTVYEVWG